MTSLDAAGITRLLHALDEELAARETTADVYLVGGAAIALSFDAARTTRDLDAVFVPTTQVRAAAEAVAEANGLGAEHLLAMKVAAAVAGLNGFAYPRMAIGGARLPRLRTGTALGDDWGRAEPP